jgi:hypothetical protein
MFKPSKNKSKTKIVPIENPDISKQDAKTETITESIQETGQIIWNNGTKLAHKIDDTNIEELEKITEGFERMNQTFKTRTVDNRPDSVDLAKIPDPMSKKSSWFPKFPTLTKPSFNLFHRKKEGTEDNLSLLPKNEVQKDLMPPKKKRCWCF